MRNAMQDAAAITREFRIVEQSVQLPNESGEISRKVRFFIWAGVIMAQPDTPRGWGWNPAVITLCLAVLSITASAGFFIGVLYTEVQQLKRDSQATQFIANTAKDRADYAMKESDKGDGHRANTNSNTQEQKK